MYITVDIDINNGRYSVQVDVTNLTAAEEEAVAQFGQPAVETGGNIAGSSTRPGDESPTSVNFDIPLNTRTIPGQFPFKRVFDTADETTADVMADVYKKVIKERITEAKNILMAKKATFVGKTTTTV